MNNGLTAKQEKFCEEVASGKTQSDAYRVAYNASNMADETINSKASILMTKGNIRARMEEIRTPAVEAAQLTLETHLRDLYELRELAKKDMKWSAAIQAEIARGKVAGLHITKPGDEDKELIVNIVRFGED
jgi:phage terminase small subunit